MTRKAKIGNPVIKMDICSNIVVSGCCYELQLFPICLYASPFHQTIFGQTRTKHTVVNTHTHAHTHKVIGFAFFEHELEVVFEFESREDCSSWIDWNVNGKYWSKQSMVFK